MTRASPLLALLAEDAPHPKERHAAFNRLARSYLRSVAEALCIRSDDYDLIHQRAGGRIFDAHILVSDQIYIHLTQRFAARTTHFLLRQPHSRRIYNGGSNIWLPNTLLAEPTMGAERIAAELGLATGPKDLLSMMGANDNDEEKAISPSKRARARH